MLLSNPLVSSRFASHQGVSPTSTQLAAATASWRAPAGRIRASGGQQAATTVRTCRNCKKQFNPSENHPRACLYHTAHFGGETKRKFESVHTGGTMDTPGGGEITSYWHCCASEDPFDPGCVAGPHASYDD